MADGGSWSLVDISTGESMKLLHHLTMKDFVSIGDGCYEISGTSGSGASYPFGYTSLMEVI